MNAIIQAAAVITAIGTIGTGVMVTQNQHTALADEHDLLVPHAELDQHLAEQRVRTIFSYMDQIMQQGPQPWLCRAMNEEFIQLCTDIPDHAMCPDRSEIIESAGC